jgi:hypothetical protein
MKITKRQLRKLLHEARHGTITEDDPPGMPQGQYSAQSIVTRIEDAIYDVVDDYVGWMARQGRLSAVMGTIESDAKEISDLAREEIDIEAMIVMNMDMASDDQERNGLVGEAVHKYGPSGQIFEPEEEYEPQDHTEYDRGYQDGLDHYPVADDATADYDAGYEDGKLDADIPEVPYDEVRSKDW